MNESYQLYSLATSLAWTHLIRSIVIYEYNEFNSSRNVAYGYLKRQYGYISLYFTPDGKAAKQALFTTTDVPGQTNDKTTSMAGISSPTTTSNQESVLTGSSLSAESTTDESIPQQSKHTIQNSDVGVSVGLSVTAVIIVVTAVVIIVTLKRRGKIQTKCFRQAESECSAYISTELHPSSKNDKNAYEMSLGSPYDQIDDLGLPSEPCSDNEGTDNGISGHTYFILEKHTWESDTDDDIENRTKIETSNVYNTLISNEKTGSNESGNTYDTTEKVVTKLKAQHHTHVEDSTENTYNLTGSRPVKIGKTDNVYGVLNNVEGEYNNVDTRNIKSQFNGRDTYSHIMKKN
ncbi:uncharacterized protein LOC132737473 [Ruditapes philippinarum]|uniref:uncharacterized protein LOC132737473 n=1 Tax=Ruditapes philippinarum TaxID=129788 RepID=UPI00295BDB13|nr:uncharacterized protein LOC132737473 [Ruditapes philippinarum]